MNRFSRIKHHVSIEDVKKKHLESIAVENFKVVENDIVKEISDRFKRDWRKELEEGMTTGNALSTVLPAEGDTAIDQVSPVDATSFADVNNMFGTGADNPALDGTSIRANGSGSGDNGGFNVGGNYLAFQGNGSGGSRMALLKPMDATKVDTLTITAIRGNSSNGGEEADIVGQEELFVIYKTPDMSQSSYLSQDRNRNNIGSFPADAAIIAIGQGDGTLQDYTITIPEYARQKDTVFGLFQLSHSGSVYDHYGVTDIKFQRKTPINVVVPLDSPEAISFVRVGTNEGDPKKRKKKVNDQLAASDEYTSSIMGAPFPGQGARIDGEDPFKSAEVQDVTEPSPIGKDEVKKSFSNFSTQAADAEPESEPEVEEPSTQTTLAPRSADGSKMKVKSVGAKNSGVVQGADAANVDAQNAQEPETTEPETTEPETTEPETDPEEIKASEEEKQGKTEEEIEEIENEKFNTKADESANAIEKLINFRLDQGLASFNAIAQVTGVAVNAGINIASLALNVLGMKEANGLISMLGKVQNSIDIARSVLSGKVTNANVLPQEITSFTNSMKPDEFQAKKIFISDVRHEYADDNIYVKNGEIYSNRDGDRQGVYASPLANQGFEALGIHGSGYAQMIIPKDGSDPYLHYYDHNYENLNNISDVSATGGIISTITGGQEYYDGAGALFKSISNIIHQLKTDNTKFIPQKLRGTLLQYFMSFDQVLDGLKSTSSLEGFPPGIHGSALTDFKVPLSKLPQETQDMIAKHPLSWTPERVANMSEDQIYDQLYPLLETDEQFQNYLDFTTDITKMSTEPVNTVPYAVAMQEMDEVVEQYENDTLEKYGEDGWEEFTSGLNRDSEFFAAQKAAVEDIETLKVEEEKELDENDSIRGTQVQLDLWDKLVKPAYDAFVKATTGGSVSGDSPIKKRLEKQHAKWKKQADKMSDDFYRIQSEIMGKYRDQREPIENIANAQLRTLREPVKDSPYGQPRWKTVNYDGDESSGADYTALDGTVYKGQNTYYDEYYNGEEQFYTQINALYEPVADLQKYVDGGFVRENIAGEFENNFGFSSDNWSPAKSGDGVRKGDDSFVDPFANEIKPGLGAQDGDELASAEKGNYDLYNWILKTYNNMDAAEWYLKTGKTKNNPFLPQGSYVPLASTLRNLGSVASVGGVDATAAATAAAASGEKKKKKKKKGTTSSMVAHYQPTGSDLLEKYARPQPKKQLERLKSKGFFNPKDIKPTFPPNDPPELDPKTKMHPNYGKQAGRYKRLDPISANAMPPTGDPEIDAVVDKQKTKPKTKKQKYLAKVAESKKYTWREDFTNVTTGMKVGQTFRHNPSGQTVTTGGALGGIETVPSTVSIFGDSIPGPTVSQYGLQGFAKPILMKRRDAEDTNKKLDASQEFAQKVGADVMMNARVDDELEKLKKILDEKTKKLDDLNKKISELNKLAAKQSKKISKMRDDGLKKINAKYNERNNVRDEMVRKFEASFPSLTYNAMGNMIIQNKADSKRYYAEQDAFYAKVDATWNSMTKKIDAERKTFLEKMDNLYDSTVGKYNQEEFNLTQHELPTAKAQYDEALKNHSDKLLEKNKLNQEQNMLKGMIDEVTSMFASYFRKQLGGGLPLPVELTLRYAMGNMDPLTKSPGTLFNAITMKAITNAFNTKSNTVNPHHYHSMDERLVQAAYNNFSYQVTPNGIRVMDTFNFDDPDAGGATIGAFKVIPGAQWLATQLVKAGDRNARSKGIDPRDDRFGIKVDYTIPKSDLTPDQIKLFYSNKSKSVEKIKGLAGEKARKGLSLDQPIISPKKKKSLQDK